MYKVFSREVGSWWPMKDPRWTEETWERFYAAMCDWLRDDLDIPRGQAFTTKHDDELALVTDIISPALAWFADSGLMITPKIAETLEAAQRLADTEPTTSSEYRRAYQQFIDAVNAMQIESALSSLSD